MRKAAGTRLPSSDVAESSLRLTCCKVCAQVVVATDVCSLHPSMVHNLFWRALSKNFVSIFQQSGKLYFCQPPCLGKKARMYVWTASQNLLTYYLPPLCSSQCVRGEGPKPSPIWHLGSPSPRCLVVGGIFLRTGVGEFLQIALLSFPALWSKGCFISKR